MTGPVAQTRTLPDAIHPMLARLTRRSFNSTDYLFELKWDGIRALAFIEGGEVRLQSRNLQDLTPQFPELSGLPTQVDGDRTVLDGELVCFDRHGHPSMALMQRRLRRQASGRSVSKPQVSFVAFDLLYAGGESAMGEVLAHRKALLHQVLKPTPLAQPCEFVEGNGAGFFQATCELGLEGIVAKDRSSLYVAGKRSPAWLKIKRVRESDFVVGGYTFGGTRREPFSSLLLGLYDDHGRFTYVGQVGSGFSRSETREVHSALDELHTGECPFTEHPAVQKFIFWCRPQVVCRVEYGEFNSSGRLRYAVYQTLRDDKPADDCRTVDAPGWPRDVVSQSFLV